MNKNSSLCSFFTSHKSLKVGAFLFSTLMLSACGGGGGGATSATGAGSGGNAAPAPVANTLAMTVERGFDVGSSWYPNQPFVSLDICNTDMTGCITLPKVLVDTGSYGLRVFESALGPLAPSPVIHQGGELRQCAGFGSGYTLGRIAKVGLKMAGATARDLPIQVIETSPSAAPNDCASTGTAQFTAKEQVGGNAILGIGPLASDAVGGLRVRYYVRTGNQISSLSPVPSDFAVPNPIVRLDQHANGVILDFPAVQASGNATHSGSLILGLNTAGNNATTGVSFLRVNDVARLWINVGGSRYPGLIDSGSNYYHFPYRILAPCAGSIFFCPSAAQQVPMTLQDTMQSMSLGRDITIDDYQRYGTNAAQPGLAGYESGATEMILGLPFFYGRKVYVSIQGKGAANVPAPAIGL